EEALIKQLDININKPFEGKPVVIETNNPNPFKAMHIGHAFNAILADTIANLIETGGAHTYRVSYHGDIGLHVGKSMYALLKFVEGDPKKLDTIEPKERNSFMSRMYADGAKSYAEDEHAKTEIDKLTEQSFTREDLVYAEVYDTVKDWSFEQIDDIVKRLGNKPIERRFLESDADTRGIKIVRDHVPEVFQESDGALVFLGSKHGSFDNVFVTARGRGLYGARDLGLMQLKSEYYQPDKSYIVTAEEQKDYFKGVIAAAELCFPDQKNTTVNIPHGVVKLTTGKMSSRSGDVVEIDWLFDRIADAVKTRGGNDDPAVIAGALRYQFLKVRVGSDVVFDVDEAVSVEGNSGPYLQYAHARARSILNKKSPASATLEDLEPGERSLVRKLSEYSEVVNSSINDLMPHHVANYLYELAQTFNRFYEKNRVLGDPREAYRLVLVQKYADILKNGLELLGIPAPEKM
ncbi:MAG TPA: arginine--tRNA ligase, partial [Candidatus Saccharimonadales bacterium]|nr:arginine--tRNA ligase [Candidatus Saccharimonadales bacterium]